MTADISRGRGATPLLPATIILFIVTENADVRGGAAEDGRFVIAPRNIIFAVPAAIPGHSLKPLTFPLLHPFRKITRGTINYQAFRNSVISPVSAHNNIFP